MKILILPSNYITNYSNRNFRIFLTYLKNVCTKFKINYEEAKQYYYLSEHYHYSHVSNILGKANTFIIGNYYKDYSTKKIPNDTRYPSLHASPEATHISFNYAKNNISQFDAIIVGIRTGEKGSELRNLAKKKGVLVACLDYADHPEVYREDIIKNKKIMYRSLDSDKDFDIFFKHDVPINYEDNKIYPICPTPINFENYPKINQNFFSKKNINISFLGRLHPEIQKERSFLAEYIEKNFDRTHFMKFKKDNVKRLSLKDYCEIMNNSKILFSPSGKVWDSARHAEAALYKCVPLISKPYCKLSSDIKINESNSIFYNVKLIDKSYQIINTEYLFEKIEETLKNENIYASKANLWFEEMKNKNTHHERAKYIVNIIKSNLIKKT